MSNVISLSAVAVSTVSTMDLLKDNRRFGIVLDKEVEAPTGKGAHPAVTFVTNTGKGSGAQVVLTQEFPEVVSVLREALDNGVDNLRTEAGYEPAQDIARRTIGLVAIDPANDKPSEDPNAEATHVQFHTRTGKGSKPARIPLNEFASAVEFLENAVPQIANVLESKGIESHAYPDAGLTLDMLD